MANITVFKIKSTLTGLFSTGGSSPDWSKKGKTWSQRGHVSLHLSGLCGNGRRIYRQHDAVVVECVIKEEDVSTIKVSEWLSETERKAREKEADREARNIERARQERLQQYVKLKKEFGDTTVA
jgi:hypothetical protein